jgi:hypothetical protein
MRDWLLSTLVAFCIVSVFTFIGVAIVLLLTWLEDNVSASTMAIGGAVLVFLMLVAIVTLQIHE